MSKYINADNFIIPKGTIDDIAERGVPAIHDLLDIQPSADVRENTHREWKGGAFCGYDMYGETVITPITCSGCKYEVEEVSNFCPNCGAVMRYEMEVDEYDE